MCSLFGRNSSDDFFCLSHIFSCNPALRHVAFHVIFTVYVSRVDTCFLQSSLYGFLHLFSFRLFNGNFNFFLLNFFRNAVLIDSQRVHGSNLHSHLLSQLFVNVLVESNDCAKAVSVHVIVNNGSCTLYGHITVEFHFFTCDTATVGYRILHSAIAHRQCLHFIQSLALVGNSKIKDILSQFHEVSILSNEVGFAFQSDDNGKVTGSLSQNATFRSLAV